MKFSTPDQDNDNRNLLDTCANLSSGAFWYNNCLKVNPLGLYGDTSGKGIIWYDFEDN